MTGNELHLEGTLLEALVAGAATEEERMHAEAHLAECPVCSAEVRAMREENSEFAAELAREIPKASQRSAGRSRVLFMVMGALAASAILLVFLPGWLGEGERDNESGSALAERREAPREEVGEDGPRPPDPAPPIVAPPAPHPVTPNQPVKATSVPEPEERTAGPQTYEGKSAEEWIRELLTTRGTNRVEIGEMALEPSADRKSNPKAQHALTRLGAAAVPALLNALKRPDLTAPQRNVLSEVLAKIEPPESQIDRTLDLLKNRDFEVRRSAVRMLAKHLDNSKVVEALRRVQKEDPDAAVIEAAEEALADLKKGADAALLKARQLVMAQKFDEAIAQLQEALAHDPNSLDARGLLDATRKAKEEAEAICRWEKHQEMIRRGENALKMSDWQTALQCFKEACAIEPTSVDAKRALDRAMSVKAQAEEATAKKAK